MLELDKCRPYCRKVQTVPAVRAGPVTASQINLSITGRSRHWQGDVGADTCIGVFWHPWRSAIALVQQYRNVLSAARVEIRRCKVCVVVKVGIDYVYGTSANLVPSSPSRAVGGTSQQENQPVRRRDGRGLSRAVRPNQAITAIPDKVKCLFACSLVLWQSQQRQLQNPISGPVP